MDAKWTGAVIRVVRSLRSKRIVDAKWTGWSLGSRGHFGQKVFEMGDEHFVGPGVEASLKLVKIWQINKLETLGRELLAG